MVTSRRSRTRRVSGYRRPTVEGLESRQLLAVTLATYPLPSSQSLPFQIAPGPGGELWFTENKVVGSGSTSIENGAIGAINPATKAIIEFPIPYAGSSPDGIVWGPDGDLWFADSGNNSIGQLDPTNGAIVEYPTPTASSAPTGIAVGADGNLWFTEFNTGKVGEISPTTHAIHEYPLGTTTSRPSGIVAGPDGNLWFTEYDRIGQINPTTHAVVEFQIPEGEGLGPECADRTDRGRPGREPLLQHDPGPGLPLRPALPGRYQPDEPRRHPAHPRRREHRPGDRDGPERQGLLHRRQRDRRIRPGDGALAYSTVISEPVGSAALAGGITVGPDGNLWFTDIGLIGAATIIPANQNSVAGTLTIQGSNGSAVVSGRTVYVDLKGDGTFDAGDPSGVTDANGNFAVNGVPSGSYTLRVVDFPGDVTSTLPLTLTGGQLVQNQQLVLQPTSAILPLTYLLAPFGPSNPDVTTAEVTALYTIVLGRAPDAPGLAGWVNAIKGGLPYAQVVNDFLYSPEYDRRVIAADYQTFAGRAPSPAESAAWVGLMQQHYTEEQVAYLMLTSPEFNSLHPDNSSFIQALYGDLLGREASTSEVSSWESFLSGGASRDYIVYLFLHSQGAYLRAIDGLFAIALDRATRLGGRGVLSPGPGGRRRAHRHRQGLPHLARVRPARRRHRHGLIRIRSEPCPPRVARVDRPPIADSENAQA